MNDLSDDNDDIRMCRWDSIENEVHELDSKSVYRMNLFEKLLAQEYVDIQKLKSICWNGIPYRYRGVCWQLLLGYLPTVSSRRRSTLKRKRKEYWDTVRSIYQEDESERTEYENKIFYQVEVDVLRTNSTIPLYRIDEIRELERRVLYIWGLRHPASGYVQGINDLVPPFLTLFLINYTKNENIEQCADITDLEEGLLNDIEADCYWCFNAITEAIQDNYTAKQPGIHAMMERLESLLKIVNKPLYNHIINLDVLFIQFSFRWMNCLLIRELPNNAVRRLWDTYFSDDDYPKLHVFVCLVLIQKWSSLMLTMDFSDFLIFVQDLPTENWDEEEISTILSEAFVLQYTYENAVGHLNK